MAAMPSTCPIRPYLPDQPYLPISPHLPGQPYLRTSGVDEVTPLPSTMVTI